MCTYEHETAPGVHIAYSQGLLMVGFTGYRLLEKTEPVLAARPRLRSGLRPPSTQFSQDGANWVASTITEVTTRLQVFRAKCLTDPSGLLWSI